MNQITFDTQSLFVCRLITKVVKQFVTEDLNSVTFLKSTNGRRFLKRQNWDYSKASQQFISYCPGRNGPLFCQSINFASIGLCYNVCSGFLYLIQALNHPLINLRSSSDFRQTVCYVRRWSVDIQALQTFLNVGRHTPIYPQKSTKGTSRLVHRAIMINRLKDDRL